MARSWKSRRFLSVILAVALFFCVAAPVSATEPEKAEETGTADFVAAAEGEIGGYALSPDFSALVFSSILPRAEADASCTWNERTQVASCIPTYDLSGSLNGCVLNLQTDGAATGYMVYSFSGAEACLVQFGYDGVYCVQGEVLKAPQAGEKVLFVGLDTYLKEKNGNYYDLSSGTALQKAQLAEARLQMAESAMRTAELGENPAALRAARSAGQTRQVVYEAVDVKNLWYPDFVPFTRYSIAQDDYHCAPIAAMNLMKYWKTKRGINNLYVAGQERAEFLLISYYMGTDWDGTNHWEAYTGFQQYLTKKGKPAASSCYYQQYADWNWMTNMVQNSRPFVFIANLVYYTNSAGKTYPDGKIHSFLGTGYQECSDGDYIRVCDGYSTNLSNFYNWGWTDRDFKGMWYYAWG